MVDCTGSMGPWINEVKKKIKSWSEQLHANHTHLELHLAFVRYTDYDQPSGTRITSLDFTTWVELPYSQIWQGIKFCGLVASLRGHKILFSQYQRVGRLYKSGWPRNSCICSVPKANFAGLIQNGTSGCQTQILVAIPMHNQMDYIDRLCNGPIPLHIRSYHPVAQLDRRNYLTTQKVDELQCIEY